MYIILNFSKAIKPRRAVQHLPQLAFQPILLRVGVNEGLIFGQIGLINPLNQKLCNVDALNAAQN